MRRGAELGAGRRVVMAIAAHPDDIEFLMAGTLLRLAGVGWEVHYWNVTTGSCGSRHHEASKLKEIRAAEARLGARLIGAEWHAPLADDLELFYEDRMLRRVAAVIRMVQPSVVLTHSLEDYMEDHEVTARLAVSATFARGMPNYRTSPPAAGYEDDVTVYHAMPHGLMDAMRRRIVPEMYVDVTDFQGSKIEALAAHQSQQDWLDASQGMNSYLAEMDSMGRKVGAMSGKFRYAEGWRRHSHLGFCGEAVDPLGQVLGRAVRREPRYQPGGVRPPPKVSGRKTRRAR